MGKAWIMSSPLSDGAWMHPRISSTGSFAIHGASSGVKWATFASKKATMRLSLKSSAHGRSLAVTRKPTSHAMKVVQTAHNCSISSALVCRAFIKFYLILDGGHSFLIIFMKYIHTCVQQRSPHVI